MLTRGRTTETAKTTIKSTSTHKAAAPTMRADVIGGVGLVGLVAAFVV